MELAQADIQQALNRRKPAVTVASTSRSEGDIVEILSGVFEGKTTGTPISLLIRNSDARSSSYDELKEIFRPGQGDFTYLQKYGCRDWRGGGRASGRETAARVAAGAIAEKLIAAAGMEVLAYTKAIGNIKIDAARQPGGKDLRRLVRGNILFCPDGKAASAMEKELAAVRKAGDSLGGVVEIIVRGCLSRRVESMRYCASASPPWRPSAMLSAVPSRGALPPMTLVTNSMISILSSKTICTDY
jgi:chorismate synthase